MQIEKEHIREWIGEGVAQMVPASISGELARYIESQPWIRAGTRLDWDVIGGVRANLAELNDVQLVELIKETSLGADQYLLFLYGENDPCIVCEMEFGLLNIDYAFYRAPGVHYLFGAVMGEFGVRPIFDHFAEYDGGEILVIRQ